MVAVEQSKSLHIAGAQEPPERVLIGAAHLSDLLSALARKHQIPGAQLAIHYAGETVAVEVGELCYGTGRQVTRHASFPIGSITKTLTATLAMILVADGDIELDAPLGDYLPELTDLGAQLTLRQVLSHTGGFADPGGDEMSTISMQRYVLRHCRRHNLVLPPGAGFSYSNLGYVLVGHLIETITGMSWWESMESILLQPLGIEPTFIAAPDPRPPGRPIATGHSVNPAVGRTRPVDQSLALAEGPVGALAMSAVDLVELGMIHVGAGRPDLLPATYAEQMRQAIPGADPFGLADGWGLGLALFRGASDEWVGHDGNADGTACYLRVDPANDCVVAFTSNANIGLAMWQDLLAELSRTGLPITSYSTIEALGRPTAQPPGCVGGYVNGDTEYVVTAPENGHCHLAVDGEVVARLTFYESLIFSQQDVASGQWMHAGRCIQGPTTGDISGIQVNGRVARRRQSHKCERTIRL